jgi:hypothetical protein
MTDEYTKSLESRVAELEAIISINATKMYVPTIGSILELTRDWSFKLHYEWRNDKLMTKLFGTECKYRWDMRDPQKPKDVTFPKGTRLKVARIYVRQGVEDFDSITFTINKHPTDKKLKARFWCKLNDANKIEFFLVDGKGKAGD